MRAGRDVREEVGTPSFTPASLVVALVLPMLPPIAPSLDSRAEYRTPLENLCNPSSSSSLTVLFPISIGFLHDGELLVCLETVISSSWSTSSKKGLR
jgi:hypothetical protein